MKRILRLAATPIGNPEAIFAMPKHKSSKPKRRGSKYNTVHIPQETFEYEDIYGYLFPMFPL